MTAPAITPGAIPVAERRVSGGLWSDAGRRLLRNKPAVFGLACIMLFVFVALFAPVSRHRLAGFVGRPVSISSSVVVMPPVTGPAPLTAAAPVDRGSRTTDRPAGSRGRR